MGVDLNIEMREGVLIPMNYLDSKYKDIFNDLLNEEVKDNEYEEAFVTILLYDCYRNENSWYFFPLSENKIPRNFDRMPTIVTEREKNEREEIKSFAIKLDSDDDFEYQSEEFLIKKKNYLNKVKQLIELVNKDKQYLVDEFFTMNNKALLSGEFLLSYYT